jgi:hypothetical protein
VKASGVEFVVVCGRISRATGSTLQSLDLLERAQARVNRVLAKLLLNPQQA